MDAHNYLYLVLKFYDIKAVIIGYQSGQDMHFADADYYYQHRLSVSLQLISY